MQETATLIRAALLSVFRQENINQGIPENPQQQRQLLGNVLIASNHNWKEETLTLLDKLYQSEHEFKVYTSIKGINHEYALNGSSTRVAVWRGDILSLQVDAIVNAANEYGLGCFQPKHKCIDNVIHRNSGPRLRIKCREAMQERGSLLAAGTEPIVTPGFHLASGNIIHVTGPQVVNGNVTEWDREALASAYSKSLDMARMSGCKSIAFPCISTGLFGFPADQAADIALLTVHTWIQQHPIALESVIFNVFTDNDQELYQDKIRQYYYSTVSMDVSSNFSPRTQKIQLAKNWIDNADAVLICAGAGMSVKEGEMVYTNPQDFAQAYPWFPQWGYRTSYEVMGLEGDASVPREAKWALYAKHMQNMRWNFLPNTGYDTLLSLVKDKDYFVLTSNVDACFERAGFHKDRIYTPQGEWTHVQCQRPCRLDSVYKSRPYIDSILSNISSDGMIPSQLLPKCPRCHSEMFGNVRAGSNFLHYMYESQNDNLHDWMQSMVDSNAKVVVVEIGAGFNTPTVTRFPAESFAIEVGNRTKFVRINPKEAQVPYDLNAIAIEEGWQVLDEIAGSNVNDISKDECETIQHKVREKLLEEGLLDDSTLKYRQYFGHFDWRRFLLQLKDD